MQPPGGQDQAGLAPDEQYASDDEMQLLYTVMSKIFNALSNGFTKIVGIMKSSPNLAKTMGDMTFQVCGQIYSSAAQAQQVLPLDIFMMQGGAVYQTIDALGDMAEAAKLPITDEDRKNALGYAIENYHHSRISQGNIKPDDFMPHIKQMEDRAGIDQSNPMLQANSMSSAVSDGLKSQGLLGGMSQ